MKATQHGATCHYQTTHGTAWPTTCLVLGVRIALGVAVDVGPAQQQRDHHDQKPLYQLFSL